MIVKFQKKYTLIDGKSVFESSDQFLGHLLFVIEIAFNMPFLHKKIMASLTLKHDHDLICYVKTCIFQAISIENSE